MKVLMISDVYFPRVNGVSTSMQTYRRELESLGASVTVIAPDYGDTGNEDSILRVKASKIPFDPEDRLMSLSGAKCLAGGLGRHDIVHIQTPFIAHYAGIAVAKGWGVPCLTTYHTFFEEYFHHYIPFLPKGWLKLGARTLSRDQCNQVDEVVVPSSAMARTLEDYGVRQPIHIIPTGIPDEMYRPGNGSEFRAKHGIGRNRKMMLFVGRVAKEKNIEFLVRAAQRAKQALPGLLLVIAGEGPAEGEIRKLITALNMENNALMLGNLDRNDALIDCYAAADAFVFASRTETQGLVLLEAMAAGKPVISIAHMGTLDILKTGCGAIIPEDDEEAFAAEMIDLMRDESRREAIGEAALAHADQWRAKEIAKRMLVRYESLVKKMQTGR